jgi:hypothetical protein
VDHSIVGVQNIKERKEELVNYLKQDILLLAGVMRFALDDRMLIKKNRTWRPLHPRGADLRGYEAQKQKQKKNKNESHILLFHEVH